LFSNVLSWKLLAKEYLCSILLHSSLPGNTSHWPVLVNFASASSLRHCIFPLLLELLHFGEGFSECPSLKICPLSSW
jgi:hypothetical protein